MSWSKKNRATPSRVNSTAARSARRIFLWKNRAEKITINTGEVNWSTMALAAVVSLLASTKQVYTQAVNTPERKVRRLSIKRYFFRSMYTPMVAPAIRERSPATAKPFQGKSLIKIPPVLHSVAQISISIMALFSFFILAIASV